MIEFGPDGYLYLSFGDGGSRGDPKNNGQNLGTLLGAILRIDIDSRSNGAPYSIPADNPFRKGPPGARPEIWAYGLRNVWRFSFDRTTGDLWAGDVGQNAWEEVDLIVGGKNYGWRSYEGFERYDSRTQPLGDVTPPLVVYSPRQGVSITGGYVYRGTRHPELVGQYLFADFESGRIWTLDANSRKASSMKLLLHPRKNIASFGESAEGELFLCAFDGRIYEFHSPR
jgi:glucose/arabinose dehydrogenase